MNEDKIYWGIWSTQEEMLNDFKITADDIKDFNVLFAFYSYENYSGTSFVLVEKDGQLFEANAGHCSCYGVEDQWELEPTTADALLKRRFEDLDTDARNALLKLLFSRPSSSDKNHTPT